MQETNTDKPARKGGRPKGIPNKTSTALKEMVLKALDRVGGEAYLARQAEANPAAFMVLVGRLLPRDMNANISFTSELAARLKEARERAGL